MIINMNNGSVTLDNGYVFGPHMSFSEFENSDYFNKSNVLNRQFWIVNPLKIDDRLFYVGLLFRENGLCQIKLKIVAPCVSSDVEIKKIHDLLLNDENIRTEFLWGQVVSVYNSKSDLSTINIDYKM